MTPPAQPPADEKLMPCRWCNSDRVHVEREETSWSGKKVVGVDEDNGPIYYVECDECMARGPLASWAIDARDLARFKALKDENGINANMMDKMVAVFAEGLSTGATDIRHLLYCAYREAQKEANK